MGVITMAAVDFAGIAGRVSWPDVAVGGAVLLAAALGFWSGFVWQLIRIGSLVFAVWFSSYYHRAVAASLGDSLSESARHIASWVFLFAAALIMCHIAFLLLRPFIGRLKPRVSDRILGAVLGAAKGMLICGALVLAVLHYAPPGDSAREDIENSPAAKAAVFCARAFWLVLPQDFRERPEGEREGDPPSAPQRRSRATPTQFI